MAALLTGDILVGTTIDGLFKIIFRPVNQVEPSLPARVPTPSPAVRTFATPSTPPRPPSPKTVKMEIPDSPESAPPSPPFLVMEKPVFKKLVEPVVRCIPPRRPPPPQRPPPPSRNIAPQRPPPPTNTTTTTTTSTPSVEVTVERAEPIGVRVTTRSSDGSSSSRIYPDVNEIPRPQPSAPPLDEGYVSPPRGQLRQREESPLPVRSVRARMESPVVDLSREVNSLNRAIEEVERRSAALLDFVDRSREQTPAAPTPVTPSPSAPISDPPRIGRSRVLSTLPRPRPLHAVTRREIELNTDSGMPVVTVPTHISE